MIYLDTSVALAQLLAGDRRPPAALWAEPLVSSRLLEYELFNRIHARGLEASHAEPARLLVSRLAILELEPVVLARALEPFPSAISTLDALHLASAVFLRSRGVAITIASYDRQFLKAAHALRLDAYRL